MLRNLRHSRAAKNAAAAYLAFVSSSVCGLVTIPIAVAHLSKEEMGLWTLVFTVTSYLLWMDLGIGTATGRKMAEAIAANDRAEISRWWTLSIGVLSLLGVLVFLAALVLLPFLPSLLNIPQNLRSDAAWLFLGCALLNALGMPMRAYPGILTAQERFHWVPLVQALMPALNLLLFWFLLGKGYGIKAYLPAIALSQVAGWAVFFHQVHSHGLPLRLDFGGFCKTRFRSLLGYSGGLAAVGLAQTLTQSLPAILLSRLGGLGAVPVYNLSNRGPSMLQALGQRTADSFYPNLQRLYVTGNREVFVEKYRHVSALSVWISLVAAGAILAGNHTLVCWLAKSAFWAGFWTNVCFALMVLIHPFVASLSNLLHYAGHMQRYAVVALLELPLTIALCVLGYRYYALPGLAAGFAIAPLLLRGPYLLRVGPKGCGLRTRQLCGKSLLALGLSAALLGGIALLLVQQNHGHSPVTILGRDTYLPNTLELLCGTLLATMGGIQTFRTLARIKDPTPCPAVQQVTT